MDNGQLRTEEAATAGGPDGLPVRLGEAQAARILERAAALDAKRSSEIEVDQLREAAADAGISREAFEQAMREVGGEPAAVALAGRRDAKESAAQRSYAAAGPSRSDFAHFTGLLRDLLGEEGQVTVVEDRIQWSDKQGLGVSISSGQGGATTATVSTEGRLKGRLLALILPVLLPMLILFILTLEGEGEAFLAFLAVLFTTVLGLVATTVQHRRERKALRKKAEQIRRQLQRVLGPTPGERTPEGGPGERR